MDDVKAAASIAEMRNRPEDGALVIQISRHTWDTCLDVADAYLAREAAVARLVEAVNRALQWTNVDADGGRISEKVARHRTTVLTDALAPIPTKGSR